MGLTIPVRIVNRGPPEFLPRAERMIFPIKCRENTIWLTSVVFWSMFIVLQRRHNGWDDVSNHQHHHCLLNCLFRRRSKKTSKLRVTGLCAGNSPVTGEFPAKMASNAANILFDDIIMGYSSMLIFHLRSYRFDVTEIATKCWTPQSINFYMASTYPLQQHGNTSNETPGISKS